jgi:hypothetical protein
MSRRVAVLAMASNQPSARLLRSQLLRTSTVRQAAVGLSDIASPGLRVRALEYRPLESLSWDNEELYPELQRGLHIRRPMDMKTKFDRSRVDPNQVKPLNEHHDHPRVGVGELHSCTRLPGLLLRSFSGVCHNPDDEKITLCQAAELSLAVGGRRSCSVVVPQPARRSSTAFSRRCSDSARDGHLDTERAYPLPPT